MNRDLIRELQALLGPANVLSLPEELLMYEYDGSIEKSLPDAVVFPTTTQHVSAIVKIANKYDTPIVGRGAGTGLSGGAIPRAGGVMLVFARMNRILTVDYENLRAVVQPGLVNAELTRAVEHAGLYFAPDPSSQKSCTIGGNVSENSGGPHTLAYGVTTNHVTALELVLPDGEILRIGNAQGDALGYDLPGLFVGSEGTLALVTEITVRLCRKPEAVKTLLAIFDSIDSESAADVLTEMEDPKMQASVLEALETEKAAEIVEEMAPDEAADVLSEMEEATSEEILEEMDSEPKSDVRELLEFEEDTAGGLMNTEYVALPENATAADALAALRGNEDLLDTLNTLFLLDADGRLVAGVPLARLFLAPPAAPLRELATDRAIQVGLDEKQDRLTELFDKYNLLTLPVVDEEGKLSGVITADDIISVLRQR